MLGEDFNEANPVGPTEKLQAKEEKRILGFV